MGQRDIPLSIMAKRPKPGWAIATDRESNQPKCLACVSPSLSEGSKTWRKWSPQWWESRRWEYTDYRNNHPLWRAEWDCQKSPFLKDFRVVYADTEEDAINEYNKARNN